MKGLHMMRITLEILILQMNRQYGRPFFRMKYFQPFLDFWKNELTK